MDYELISAEEFDKLPEDDEQCFVAFEAICHRNMTQMMEEVLRTGMRMSCSTKSTMTLPTVRTTTAPIHAMSAAAWPIVTLNRCARR